MIDLRTLTDVDRHGVAHEAEITEPDTIPTLFVDGMMAEFGEGFVRFTGWTRTMGDGGTGERRIVCRMVLSDAYVRQLVKSLQSGLARGGH